MVRQIQIRVYLPEAMLKQIDEEQGKEQRSKYIQEAVSAYQNKGGESIVNHHRSSDPIVWRFPNNGVIHAG